MNTQMDLTGKHPNHRVENKVVHVFRMDQTIDLDTPVFADSIKVVLLSGGVNVTLEKDKDYYIPETLITSCDNDMSRAKLLDKSFNEVLCRGFIMRMAVDDAGYSIAITYQRLYPIQYKGIYHHGEPLVITPDVIYSLIQDVEQLVLLNSRVTEVGDLTEDKGKYLPIDVDKTNPNNFIEDEVCVVNVLDNRAIILPTCGSFYLDSVIVKHPATNSVLEKDKDYLIIGMDEARTKATSHTSPVYQFIAITAPIVGEVHISYHAFGGMPTVDNYRDLLDNINNVISYLNNANTLTAESLGNTPLMIALFERMSKLEESMRRLEGKPSYGDITSGKSIYMKLFTDKPGLHWYTIASLYKVNGGRDISTADTMNFRLQTKQSHIQVQCAVAVDLHNEHGTKMNVSTVSENYPRGYVPFVDYSKQDRIIRPQLRVVWANDGELSGAYLQLGFELKGMAEEGICIEDMSGHESCWKLVDETVEVTQPDDNNFILPNGKSVWSKLSATCHQESMLIPYKDGHLIWSGEIQMNRPNEGWQQVHLHDADLMVDKNTDITRFQKLRLDIAEEGGMQFPIDIHFNSGYSPLKGHGTFTYMDRPVYVNVTMFRENDELECIINFDVTAGSDNNKLTIRDLVIYT